MDDAPERAVIFHKPGPGKFVRLEFVRADLVPDARAIREAALREAARAVSLAAWKHVGDDSYSAGLDEGARRQNQEDYNAILALIEKGPGQ